MRGALVMVGVLGLAQAAFSQTASSQATQMQMGNAQDETSKATAPQPGQAVVAPPTRSVGEDPPKQPVSKVIDPPDAQVVYTAHGAGQQVYLCSQQPDAMKWILEGPAATLTDVATNQPVGKHGPGPQWTWNDGSAVRGKVIGSHPAPDAANVPWLLLRVDLYPGPNGPFDTPLKLDEIKYVRRTETHGGVGPTSGCDAANIGASVSVPYSATYTFYAQAQ